MHYPVRRGESDAANPLLGTVVDGKYRLQGVLGRGGLGTVFRAQHIGSLLTVALKVLHPRFAERPEYRRALLPEARRAAAVTHDCCARVLDVGEAEHGVAYLAMELAPGQTLDQLLRAGRPAPSHVVEILAQVAAALGAIHDVGLVHCDLSPRNVMVAAQGGQLRVKVLDFGIARSATIAGGPGAGRAAGEFAGFANPAFAAPELLAGDDVDPRADLWSFGMLGWLLLTGDMPVDDADPRRAAAAVIAGELRPWPRTPGVPRRLVRLLRWCLARDRAARPASVAVVARELALVRGARRPLLARAAVAALAVAVVAALAEGAGGPAPFLRPWSGSALAWTDGALPSAHPTQHLPSARLATLGFHYGGFAANRLRADVARGGAVLAQTLLRPEVDAAAGTLRLSVEQPDWRELVQGLVRSSRDGPVDLVLVVPGAALLGATRVQLDDEPPVATVELLDGDAGLTGATRLVCRASDDVGVAGTELRVVGEDGRTHEFVVPADGTPFALGAALAAATQAVTDLGPGELRLRLHDRAGNERRLPPIRFAEADVAAPDVVEVTGPSGEPFATVLGERLRLRVRLSAEEPGCTLTLTTGPQAVPQAVPLGAGTLALLEFDAGDVLAASSPWRLEIVDGAGNRSQRELTMPVRDRSLRLELLPVGGGARWTGRELVLADRGAAIDASFAPALAVVGAALQLAEPPVDGTTEPVRLSSHGAVARLEFGPLPPGSHTLRFDLREGDGEQAFWIPHVVPVRVLPPAVEVRVPASRSRFLPGLLQAGVLARRGQGLAEGAGWRIDPALRPYVRGTLWVGGDRPVALELPPAAAGEPLLPAVVPAPGRNTLAVELVDMLGRPVLVQVGEAGAAVAAAGERVVVADFWWHDGPPEVVGEELLVEYGQPVRVDVRFPLPFDRSDADALRLVVAQSEIVASAVATQADGGAVATFRVPFPVWSVPAQLAERTRDQFAAQLAARVEAAVLTPAGRAALGLRLRTTRSTLRPVTLGELADVPAGLRSLRLLPVLAPSAPFAEPVPVGAPPRAAFRPQVAVAVRNLADFLLQDGEFTCGQARALAVVARTVPSAQVRACVHHDDPRGVDRLLPVHLLPAAAAAAPAEALLTGVDFYQAYALCRLLGVAVGGDPRTFRLPLGCELELAAFGNAARPACHGALAQGDGVAAGAFVAADGRLARGEPLTAAELRAAGDVVPTAYDAPFVGLDFGVREWVFDLPQVPGAEPLLRELLADRAVHLDRVEAMARGVAAAAPDPAGPWRLLGVVRGLPFGQRSGVLDRSGAPFEPSPRGVLPASVPGVLRTEQLRRDGGDLLGAGTDPRLSTIGFRVAVAAADLPGGRERR